MVFASPQGFITVSSVTKDFGVRKFVKALTYSKPILGNQKSWEIRNLGKSEILGNQKSWEIRNLGKSEILGNTIPLKPKSTNASV